MTTRQMFRKRVGPDGEMSNDCDADVSPRLDIAETKKAFYERGKGPAYQKTVYTFKKDAERTYDDPLTISEIDIDYQRGVFRKVVIESGKGPSYQRTVLRFDNSEENTNRQVRIQTIDGTDGAQIDVERIQKFKMFTGKGPAYQAKRIHLLNDEENETQFDDLPCE